MSEQNDTSLMADVIGTKIDFSPDGAVSEDGWKKLSVAVQPYSDKRYETARYFFVNKDGQVVRHVAVSARQPSATNIKPSEKFLLALRTYASQNDCRIVFMHNHPSGYVRPSEADISLTEKLESYFVDIEGARRFLGHIISGYGSFGIYEPYKDGGWKSLVDGRFGDISRIDETFKFQEGEFNLRARTDSDLIDLKMKADELDSVGAWDKERWVPCCFATQNGIVRKFDHISVLDFSNPGFLAETLKSTGRENNSDLVYLLPNSRKQFLMCEGFAQKTRMVEDNFYINPDDTMEHSGYGGGRIFGMTRLDEILVQDTDQILSREERDKIIGNKKFKGDNFMETNIKEQAGEKESNKLNFVLEKLEFAGIEVVQDKAEFDRIIEQEKLVQKMTVDLSEFEKTEKEIQQLKNSISNISEDNKNLVREQEFIDFQTSLIACKKYIENLPEKELPVMPFITSNDRGEELTFNFLVKIKNNELVLTAGKPAESVLYNFETKVAESPWSLERFKDFTASTDCCEILVNTINKHLGEELGKQRSILKKLMQENAILSGKSLNEIKNGKIKLLPQTPELADFSVVPPASSTISQTENKSSVQQLIQNEQVYGFTYNDKIYLNPDIMNSEVAVHEYTHLWDNYTQRTNSELWQKGKDIFKETYLWDEVKADPNYADISDNDDLILSEVHSRICGKMAEKVLEKILERDGELTKNTVIDWDKETWNYICEEFLGKENITLNYPNGQNSKDLTEFLALPMKDFMEGREITRDQSVNSRNNPDEIEKKENNSMEENYVEQDILQNGKIKQDENLEKIHDTMYHTNSWDNNFPNVFSSAIYRDLKNNKNFEDLRLRAKAGDRDAADELVREVADYDMIRSLRERFPDAIIAPVVAEEASGNNQIPYAYANLLRENGFEIDTNIIQAVRAHHTGANSIKRLMNRVRFDGKVQEGKSYILIDDHIDYGGTLRDFKDYIETNGGKVVAFSTLTAIDKNIKISPTKENIEKLNQYGGKVDELLKQFGITDNKAGLTNSEIESILKLFSDKNRNRKFEDENQRRFGLLCSEIGEAYKARIKQEERTKPTLNRFLKLTSSLPQEEQSSLGESITKITNAIKSENQDVIRLVNSFNKPEYSKKSPAFSEDILIKDIKNVLIDKALSVIDNQKVTLSEPEQMTSEEEKVKTLSVEERQALKDGALIRDFFDNMKDGYKTMQSEEYKDLFPDFLSMFRDRTSFYTDEQKAAISKKIQELSGTASQEDAFKYLENRIATDVAIEQGAAWEYNDRNEKVLKENKSYTQEEKERAIKFSHDTSENQPLPDSENELINLLKQQIEEQIKQLEEQKKTNDALRKQNEMLFGKVDSLTQEISQMREQLELYKGQVSQTHGGEAREQGRGDEGYNQPGPQQETEITRPGAFTNKVAWTPNQEIPKFGKLIDGEIKICEGYVFGKFVENEKSPAENTVEVENPNLPENDPLRKIVLSEKAYRDIIGANEELERAKQNSQGIETSWEWYKAHEDYREKLHLDQHLIRSHRPENFMHNFRVACERAENYDEAMKMAKILVDNFTSYGRKRFNKERKAYGAKEFDEKLRKIYDEASADKTYRETNPFKKYIDPASKLFAKDAEENPGLYELPKGEKIPGTNMKIGDSVKMALSFTSFNGKKRRTPATEWQIKAVSQNITPARAVVYSEKAKCTYTIPLAPLVKHIQKVEKIMQKEEQKKLKKDHKTYGTDKNLQDRLERS